MMVLKPSCFFCGTTEDVHYCPVCKAYLCRIHEKDYALRAGHAISHPVETATNVLDYLLGH